MGPLSSVASPPRRSAGLCSSCLVRCAVGVGAAFVAVAVVSGIGLVVVGDGGIVAV
jgi:hypothetical protein